MAKIDLSKYGITGATDIVYNPSYELLFEEASVYREFKDVNTFMDEIKKLLEKQQKN